MRIGLATGIVVVGDLIGHGSAQERGVVGETPNLAARLQAMAKPGSVLSDDTTNFGHRWIVPFSAPSKPSTNLPG